MGKLFHRRDSGMNAGDEAAATEARVGAKAIADRRVSATEQPARGAVAGPETPIRPSNLLNIHELKADIQSHSYCNIARHGILGAAASGSLFFPITDLMA